MIRRNYENPRYLLRFIMDVAKTASKADYADDEVWRDEFQFIVEEINAFLKTDKGE